MSESLLSQASLAHLGLPWGTLAYHTTVALSLLGFCYVIFLYVARKRVWATSELQPPAELRPTFPWGNADLFAKGTVVAMQFLRKYLNQDGLVFFWIFGDPIAFVTHHEHVKLILKQSTVRRMYESINQHLRRLVGDRGIVHLHGDEWTFHRKIMAGGLKVTHQQAFVQDVNGCLKPLVSYLSANRELDVYPAIRALSMDVIGQMAFGYDLKTLDSLAQGTVSETAAAFHFMAQVASDRLFSANPLNQFYNLPTETNRKYEKCRRHLRGLLADIIQKRNQAHMNGEAVHEDFLSHMLRGFQDTALAQNPEAAGSTPDLHSASDRDASLSDNMMTLLLAGSDTTSLTMTFALDYISQHPEVQDKLRKEADEVLTEESATYQSVQALKYSYMVVKETLRLSPPTPVTTRTLTQDTLCGSTLLKKGQEIWLPIYLVHRSEHNFDKPDEFMPERWDYLDGDDEEDSSKAHRIPHFAWVPFSGGPRDCIGMRFAMLQLRLAISTLVKRFTITRAAGCNMKMGPANGTQVILEGPKLIFTPRS